MGRRQERWVVQWDAISQEKDKKGGYCGGLVSSKTESQWMGRNRNDG